MVREGKGVGERADYGREGVSRTLRVSYQGRTEINQQVSWCRVTHIPIAPNRYKFSILHIANFAFPVTIPKNSERHKYFPNLRKFDNAYSEEGNLWYDMIQCGTYGGSHWTQVPRMYLLPLQRKVLTKFIREFNSFVR